MRDTQKCVTAPPLPPYPQGRGLHPAPYLGLFKETEAELVL